MVQQIRLQTTEPLRINYYISGHGYGHATRSAKVVEALLLANPTTEVTVITTAPAHLFTSSNRLRLIAQVVDSAIIQPQPYTIDAEISLLNMEKFVRSTETVEYQTTATDLLKATSCNLIIADAPCPLAWNINKQIPSILISNFSFDAIFEELLQYLPPDNQLNVSSFVAKLRTVYANYGYVIRLPGFINFPFVDRHWTAEQKRDNVIDSPLVFRQARRSRSDVLSDLGIPKASHDQKKILLVQFGGQIVAGSSDLVPQLPKDWICLSASAPASDPRFVTFPADVYSPDLVETADVVLGKIGYGTVSECVGMNRPLIYVLRPMFAEEPGLLKFMQENGTCGEISVTDYEAGKWADIIENVHNRHSHEKSLRNTVQEGSAEVADIIHKIVARDA